MGKTIEDKTKKRKKTSRREFCKIAGKIVGLTAFGTAISLITGCPSPLENQPPITEEIETNFKDDGNVEYKVSGRDEDDYIDYISVKINGEHYGNFPNNSLILVPIKGGNNNITATAYDGEGTAGNTITNSFESPNELEASDIIACALNPDTYDENGLETNARLSPGNEPEFYVNALIKVNNKDRVIDYLGTKGDILNLYGIPNICPNRTSVEKLEAKALEFQDNGYN